MMLKLNVADCISLALKPLQNILKPSSTHKSLKAQRIEPILWTCSLARTTSSGFVKIVVVNPPKVPAMLCMRRWGTHDGLTAYSSSVKINSM